MKALACGRFVAFAMLSGCTPFTARWYLAPEDAGSVVVTILNTSDETCTVKGIVINQGKKKGGGLSWTPAGKLELAPGEVYSVPIKRFQPGPGAGDSGCVVPLVLEVETADCGLALREKKFEVRFDRRLPPATPDKWLTACGPEAASTSAHTGDGASTSSQTATTGLNK